MELDNISSNAIAMENLSMDLSKSLNLIQLQETSTEQYVSQLLSDQDILFNELQKISGSYRILQTEFSMAGREDQDIEKLLEMQNLILLESNAKLEVNQTQITALSSQVHIVYLI